MSDSNSLMNIGDLAKPATTLIEKISDFTGAAFLPYQIKRVAKAEAEAEKTRALANIEVTDLQRRAMARILSEETRHQENIENITAKALPEVKEDAKPEDIEDDWLSKFFDNAKRFSDDKMQILWAKILAGEANKKGSFSKRTIELVSTFEKSDADLFTSLLSFVWHYGAFAPLIYNYELMIYNKHNLNFTTLRHLDAIGLITFNWSAGFKNNRFLETGILVYFDDVVHIEFPNKGNNELKIGQVLLTQAGKELSSICAGRKLDDFFIYTLQHWQSLGYILSSPLEDKNNRENL